MEDLDSFLQNEIESINDMFQEFQTQDQQLEQRQKDEEIKIMTKVGHFVTIFIPYTLRNCEIVKGNEVTEEMTLL